MLLVKLAPVCAGFFLWFLLARVAGARGKILPDWRLSWAFAALATGVCVILIAELGSALNCLNRLFVAAAWIGLDAGLLFWVGRKFWREAMDFLGEIPKLPSKFRKIDGAARWLYGAGAMFGLLLGVIALEAPTFVWDCKSYHVPRMLAWIQDQNLKPFPATDIRRVAYNPGAEIASTTLFLLADSDRPINLISWFCVMTAAIVGSFFAELLIRLFWERTGRLWPPEKMAVAGAFAFLLLLTIPEGLIQAISTENDFVAAAWNLTLAAMLVLFLREPENSFYAAGAGLALALGICTKATTFISAFPFLAVALALLLWRRLAGPAVKLASILAIAAAGLNAPWFIRNFNVFGRFLGPASISEANVNPSFGMARCVANLLRVLSIYISTPWESVTSALDHALTTMIGWTGRLLDDPSSIVPYQDPRQALHFAMPGTSFVQDGNGVGNIHAWLAVAALLILARMPWRNALGYCAACVVAGFLLSCGYLRWHPWLFRLHITYFALAMPVVAVAFAAAARRAILVFIGFFCLANAILILVFNTQYPIYAPFLKLTREQHQFGSNLYLHEPYVALAEDIMRQGCTNVLLKCQLYHFDYGLWVCLRDRGYRGTIEEFLVDNETDSLKTWQLTPQTAMVFIGIRPPTDLSSLEAGGAAQRLLQIGYYGYNATITALFPSAFSDSWWRLIAPDNHADLTLNLSDAVGIGPARPAKIRFSCRPVDGDGNSITNNVLRLIRSGHDSDFDLSAGPVDVTANATQPALDVRAVLLKPVASNQLPAYLSNLRFSWEWAKP